MLVITAISLILSPSLAPPTLTLWVGTASGHTVTYGVRLKGAGSEEDSSRRGGGKKRTLQLMPTGAAACLVVCVCVCVYCVHVACTCTCIS